MDVYLVPVGRERFELYSEAGDRVDPVIEGKRPGGAWSRLVAQFQTVLAAVDRDSDERVAQPAGGGVDPGPRRLGTRVKARLLRWLSERVAEQRLLWHLRGERDATLHVPSDLDDDGGRRLLRAILGRDADRHLAWCLVNGAAFAASGLVAVLPGPNLIAYYFAFRLVGHYLSWRGARHGLKAVAWTVIRSGPLGDLSAIASLPAAERQARVRAVADALGLRRLPLFFTRAASPTG